MTDDIEAAVQAAVSEFRMLLDEAFAADSWPTNQQIERLEVKCRRIADVARRDALREVLAAADAIARDVEEAVQVAMSVAAHWEGGKPAVEAAIRRVADVARVAALREQRCHAFDEGMPEQPCEPTRPPICSRCRALAAAEAQVTVGIGRKANSPRRG